MSLFVDVAITADSIVKAAWARAVANRERLRRRLDVQAVREDASRRGVKDDFWETVYTTPTPSLYKPDEPVAYPVPETNLMTAGRVFAYVRDISPTANNSPMMRVWSGDGLQQATLPIDWRPQTDEVAWNIVQGNPTQISSSPITYRYEANTVYVGYTLLGGSLNVYSATAVDAVSGFAPPVEVLVNHTFFHALMEQHVHVLPLKKATCVVLLTWETETRGLVFGVTSGPIYDISTIRKGQAAYRVSQTSITPITVPQSIIDRRNYNDPQPYYLIGTTSYGAGWPTLSDTGRPFYNVRTPSSFLWFGDTNLPYLSIPEPTDEDFRNLLPESVRDFPFMAFSDNSRLYNFSTPGPDPFTLTTAKTGFRWPASDGFPVFADPADPRWKSVKVTVPPDSVIPLNPEPSTAAANRVQSLLYWDWGKPDYCRGQLLALGFSTADLTP